MLVLVLMACKPETAEKPADGLRVERLELRSDAEGTLVVPVELFEDEVFQVVAGTKRGYLSTDYVVSPSGDLAFDWEDWYDGSRSLTEAVWPTEFATTINWPVLRSDRALDAGEWAVHVATLNDALEYVGDKEVSVDVLIRQAAPSGTLPVVVAYAGDLADDTVVVDGVEAAVAYWVELYAAIGVGLSVSYRTIDTDADLPDTYLGLDAVEALMGSLDPRATLMVVGESIAGDADYLYGEAGGIPGPFAAQPHAAVFVSWLANAGGDAAFDDEDILLFGETMAHEMGHYLGLFHPVEDGWDAWDAVADTPDCSATGDCEDELGDNLMFPYPVCGARACVRQSTLTEIQGGVVQGYIGVQP